MATIYNIDINQSGTNAEITAFLRLDQPGEVANSAIFKARDMYGPAADSISANNPDYAGQTRDQILDQVGFSLTGDTTNGLNLVDNGWNVPYNQSTGNIDMSNIGGIPELSFDVWEYTNSPTATRSDTAGLLADFGDMLDFNNNGLLDGNEVLAHNGQTVQDAYVAVKDFDNSYSADGQAVTVVPEPSSVLMGAALLGAMAMKRGSRAARGLAGKVQDAFRK